MQRLLVQVWQEDDGVLTFEWTLLITVLVIGIVGGLAAARDAIIDELGDIANATIHFDQSYTLPGLTGPGGFVINPISFDDNPATFSSEGRAMDVPGQGGSVDEEEEGG